MALGSNPAIDAAMEVMGPLLESEGLRLWDVEYRRESRGMVLRVYVDKEGGANVQDLARVSHQLSDLLDVRNPIAGSYTLEVSTPGVNRKLRSPEHFRSFRGERIRVKCCHLIEGRRVFVGILEDSSDHWVRIREDTGRVETIPISEIAKANYEYVLPLVKKRSIDAARSQ